MFRGDADAIIAEAELPTVACLFSADIDIGTFTGIVDGVIDEVAEDAVDERRISLNDDVLWQTVVKRHVAFFKSDGSFLYNIGYDLRHVRAFHRQLMGSIVHAIQRRDVL